MEDKRIKKYNELEEEYFSTCPNWTYDWFYDNDSYCLTWDFEENEYMYSKNGVLIQTFKNIYFALDGIVIAKKTLRQLLLETDFDFYSIN
jgi:hypothetical protein